MSLPSFPNRLALALSAVAIIACKPDNASDQRAPKSEASPESSSQSVETKPVTKSVIARVPNRPTNANEAKIQLVSSDSDINKLDANTVEKAFTSGNSMNVQSSGNMVGGSTMNGQNFSLYGCPNAYQPYGQYPYGQYNQFPQLPGAQNAQYQQAGFGQQAAPLFGGLLQSLFGGGFGLGNLFSGLLPEGGILSNFLGLFQNIQPFMQTGMFPVSLPYGQTFGDPYCYGYGSNGAYPQMPGTPYTPGAGTTPYPYSGQYQQGPYTYYTYGQQPGGMTPPANGQPGTGQPVNGQPGTGQPVNGQYPQYGSTYGSPYAGSPYTYNPYPTAYNSGSPVN